MKTASLVKPAKEECDKIASCHNMTEKWLKSMLTLNPPIATQVVCFSRLLKNFRSLNGKKCGPRSDCSYIGAVCSGSTLFASIRNLSVMLGNYLQQMTSADAISDAFFFLVALRVKPENSNKIKLDEYFFKMNIEEFVK